MLKSALLKKCFYFQNFWHIELLELGTVIMYDIKKGTKIHTYTELC